MTPTPAVCFLYSFVFLLDLWLQRVGTLITILNVDNGSKTQLYFKFHFIFSCIDFCSKVISELFCKALVHWVSAFSQFWKFMKFTTNIIFIMNKLVHVVIFLTCISELCYYICQYADCPPPLSLSVRARVCVRACARVRACVCVCVSLSRGYNMTFAVKVQRLKLLRHLCYHIFNSHV
jgi:hypothetical protein